MTRRLTDDGIAVSGDRRVFRDALMGRMREVKMIPAELARRAEISKDAVSSYMTMRSLPTDETLGRIAKALRCKPADLKKDTGSEEAPPVCEIREHNKPGYSLLVVRMAMPNEDIGKVLTTLLPFKTALESKLKRS